MTQIERRAPLVLHIEKGVAAVGQRAWLCSALHKAAAVAGKIGAVDEWPLEIAAPFFHFAAHRPYHDAILLGNDKVQRRIVSERQPRSHWHVRRCAGIGLRGWRFAFQSIGRQPQTQSASCGQSA
jgi:hypothetical protein